MTFFNISSQGDLSTTTDHLSIEIEVYFRSLNQRCMGHHVEDHSTNHRGSAHGYQLRRSLLSLFWWTKLVLSIAYTIPGRSSRPPQAHAILVYLIYTWIRGHAENQTGTTYISTKWLCWKTMCAIVSGTASKVTAATSLPRRGRSWLDWCRTVDTWL